MRSVRPLFTLNFQASENKINKIKITYLPATAKHLTEKSGVEMPRRRSVRVSDQVSDWALPGQQPLLFNLRALSPPGFGLSGDPNPGFVYIDREGEGRV